METLNILVVEDNDAAFNSYQDAADELSDANFTIQLKRSISAATAIQELKEEPFQGAIIDLNLVGEADPEKASGNEVISEIHENFRIPIIVVSGNLQNLEAEFNTPESQFLKTFSRDDRTNIEIFQEIINIFKTGILDIIGGTGLIEKKLGEVFWDHLSKDIDAWFYTDGNAERSLLRYTLNHLSVYLDEHDEGSIDSYHEAEFYLKPPIKKIIASGDILRNPESNERLILLSPACDVEIRNGDDGQETINAKSLVLAKISDSDPQSLVNNGLIKNSGKGPTVDFLSKVVKGTELKCAFIPQYKELREGVIDFQNLVTVNFDEYKEFNRLATVSESFFKDIQSRFSSYYARQGTPDLNKETIIRSYKEQHFP